MLDELDVPTPEREALPERDMEEEPVREDVPTEPVREDVPTEPVREDVPADCPLRVVMVRPAPVRVALPVEAPLRVVVPVTAPLRVVVPVTAPLRVVVRPSPERVETPLRVEPPAPFIAMLPPRVVPLPVRVEASPA